MNAREARGLMKRIRIPVLVILLVVTAGILGIGSVDDLAELVVVKIVLDPPPVVDRGHVVEVSAHVMNTGARNADGFGISLFLRPQESRGTWALHSTIEDVTLPPSHQEAYRAAFYVDTRDLQVGTYEVRVVADSANLISETDKLNNELRTTLTIREAGLGLPDLQPVALAYTPTNPGSEDDMEPWNVTTSIRNLGPVQAGQFVVAFLVNGEEFARQIRFILPPGGSTEIVAELDPQGMGLAPGTHRITVRVDPENEVTEQDDGNNDISGFLTLQAVDLVPVSLSFDKAVVRLDEEVRVTADVRNEGNGVAKNVEVGFFVGHVRFAMATIPILGRGMTATVEGILRPDRAGLTDAPAIYQIRVVADPNALIYEVDKANNEMIRPMTIQQATERRAELHPISLEISPSSPAELGKTGTVTVTSTIRNTGRAAADGFRVSFFYRVKGGVRWEPIPCADAGGCANVSLAAGLQSKHVATLPVSVLQPGVYEVRVVVDAEHVVRELDKTNNEMVTTLTLLASRLPDLTFCPMSPLTREPAGDVQQGQTVRLSLCVSNLGEQDAGPFSVTLSYCRLDPQSGGAWGACESAYLQQHLLPYGDIDVPGLKVGETSVLSAMLETKNLAPGQYRLRAEIDATEKVMERSRANNVQEVAISVLGADLTVIAVTTVPSSPVDQTLVERLDVTATILNQGVLPAGAFDVRFRLLRIDEEGIVPVVVRTCGDDAPAECRDLDHFGTATLPGIGILVPTAVRCSLDLVDANLMPGQYILRVEVDPDGRVPEHNEGNNIFEWPILLMGRVDDDGDDEDTDPEESEECEECPDLSVRDVQTRRLTESGDPRMSLVAATIDNIGEADAGPFTIRAYYIPQIGADPVLIESPGHPLRVEGLAAGRTMYFRQEFSTEDIPFGVYIIYVVVDEENDVKEESEENNSASSLLWVL